MTDATSFTGARTMANHDRVEGEFSLTEPTSGPQGTGTPARVNRDAETVGESAGGFLGGAAGMAAGAMGGPVGLVIGGIAGAIGGWWAGRGVADAITKDDDAAFRRDFGAQRERSPDRSYDDVRPAYVAGHLAARNPDYAGRAFSDVEGDLQYGWCSEVIGQCGAWPTARRYAETAFDRARKGDEDSEVARGEDEPDMS